MVKKNDIDKKTSKNNEQKTKEFSKIFKEPEKAIFCEYQYLGLLCFDSSDCSKLKFVSVFPNDNNSIMFTVISVRF